MNGLIGQIFSKKYSDHKDIIEIVRIFLGATGINGLIGHNKCLC